MAIRFRKRIKIAPGVNVNLSRSGASVSLGKRGATINVGGKGGARATVGIPGSGISYTEKLSEAQRRSKKAETTQSKGLGFFGLLGYGVLALFLFLLLRGLFTG
jgi:hypothetical protein